MSEDNWGGARKGAGRPVRGKTSKCITLTVTVEQAEQLKNLAEEENLTISQYIVEKCGLIGGPTRKTPKNTSQEKNENQGNIYTISFNDMNSMRAAETSSSYKNKKK